LALSGTQNVFVVNGAVLPGIATVSVLAFLFAAGKMTPEIAAV
jgi:hypothetical protein